jgi:hypothetical protein
MSLAGLVGADHAFYYERARVLLPFCTGARTYVTCIGHVAAATQFNLGHSEFFKLGHNIALMRCAEEPA